MSENAELLQTILKKDNLGICLNMASKVVDLKSKQIAEELMITIAYVSAIFKGVRIPSVRILWRFLNLIKLTEEQFVEIVDYYNECDNEYKYVYTMRKTANIIVDNIEKGLF